MMCYLNGNLAPNESEAHLQFEEPTQVYWSFYVVSALLAENL